MGDETWAPVARASREALILLGWDAPECLPGDPAACGGTFAQHAMANFAALKAVADHQLGHLGELGQQHGEIYWDIRGELEDRCAPSGREKIKEALRLVDGCGHEPEGREAALDPAMDIEPGDWITYRAMYPEVPDFRAQVIRFDGRNRGLVVVDEQPGMPLDHMVTWDRVVGKADG